MHPGPRGVTRGPSVALPPFPRDSFAYAKQQVTGPNPREGRRAGAGVLEAVVLGSRGALKGEMSVDASFHQWGRGSPVRCWLRVTPHKRTAACRE